MSATVERAAATVGAVAVVAAFGGCRGAVGFTRAPLVLRTPGVASSLLEDEDEDEDKVTSAVRDLRARRLRDFGCAGIMPNAG